MARGAGPGDKLYPGGFGAVTDVDIVSASEASAITDDGYESHNEGHIYRWGGQRWSEIPFPTPDSGSAGWEFWELDDIEVVSPTEAWVVGYKLMAPDRHPSRPIVGRWNGRGSRVVPTGVWGPRKPVRGDGGAGTHRLLAVGVRNEPGGRQRP